MQTLPLPYIWHSTDSVNKNTPLLTSFSFCLDSDKPSRFSAPPLSSGRPLIIKSLFAQHCGFESDRVGWVGVSHLHPFTSNQSRLEIILSHYISLLDC